MPLDQMKKNDNINKNWQNTLYKNSLVSSSGLLLWLVISFLLKGNLLAQTWKVGDIYTFPDGSKGVVCWVDPNDGTRGWAAALNDLPGSYPIWEGWGGLPDGLQIDGWFFNVKELVLESGYVNTGILRASGRSPAANAVDYENGWYIPSFSQLHRIVQVAPLIYPAVTSAGGEIRQMMGLGNWISASYFDYFGLLNLLDESDPIYQDLYWELWFVTHCYNISGMISKKTAPSGTNYLESVYYIELYYKDLIKPDNLPANLEENWPYIIAEMEEEMEEEREGGAEMIAYYMSHPDENDPDFSYDLSRFPEYYDSACVNHVRPVRDFGYEDLEVYWKDTPGNAYMKVKPEETTTYEGVVEFRGHRFELTGTAVVHDHFDKDTLYEITCASADPYTSTKHPAFKNLNVSVPQTEYYTYRDTMQTINGCDSIITLKLHVVENCENTETDTICPLKPGETYTWKDTTFLPGTRSGIYERAGTKLVESVEIDTVAYLVLTVLSDYLFEESAETTAGESYVWDGHPGVTIPTTPASTPSMTV